MKDSIWNAKICECTIDTLNRRTNDLLFEPDLDILKVDGVHDIEAGVAATVETPLGIVVGGVAVPELAPHPVREDDLPLLEHQGDVGPALHPMISLNNRLENTDLKMF